MSDGCPELALRANTKLLAIKNLRPGFTLTECMIALAVLAACSVMVGELAIWMLAQRTRIEARSEAEQLLANVLEQARALPWDELTPAWAADRKLPQGVLERWPTTKLVVRIEAEPNHPRMKRVTVEVQLEHAKAVKAAPLSMTALFAARTKEGSP